MDLRMGVLLSMGGWVVQRVPEKAGHSAMEVVGSGGILLRRTHPSYGSGFVFGNPGVFWWDLLINDFNVDLRVFNRLLPCFA